MALAVEHPRLAHPVVAPDPPVEGVEEGVDAADVGRGPEGDLAEGAHPVAVEESLQHRAHADDLLQVVPAAPYRAAADDVRRPIQILERRGPAADHPALAGLPETEYLKAFFLRPLV